MNTNLLTYYKERAKEYEKIYRKPERQEDLKAAATILQEIFKGKSVFEIACGTGYWTERIAKTATSIFATDIVEDVLEIAKKKEYSPAQVTFGIADIFDPRNINTKYESIFGGFIWSHILLQDVDRFLESVHRQLEKGGTVVFMDNLYVDESTPISQPDEFGNTFQKRKLEDGSMHLVLKNYPTDDYLQQRLQKIAMDIKIIKLKYYWILSYRF